MPFRDAFDGRITVQGVFFALVVLYIVSKALTYRRSLQVSGQLCCVSLVPLLGTCTNQWTFFSFQGREPPPRFSRPLPTHSARWVPLLPTSWWNPGLILLWKLRDGTCEYAQLSPLQCQIQRACCILLQCIIVLGTSPSHSFRFSRVLQQLLLPTSTWPAKLRQTRG